MSHFGGPPGGHHPPPGHHAPPQLGHQPEIKGKVMKIVCYVAEGFNLGFIGDEVTVVKANDADPSQQWIKDESWSCKAKDSAGIPAFALINKATGKALKHPPTSGQKISVTCYDQHSLNQDVLWTESKDIGHGWHAIRAANNINQNLDIAHGVKNCVKEGQAVIIHTWNTYENQHWKLESIEHQHGHHHGHHHGC